MKGWFTIIGWALLILSIVILNMKIWIQGSNMKMKVKMFYPCSISSWQKIDKKWHYYCTVYDGKLVKNYKDGIEIKEARDAV